MDHDRLWMATALLASFGMATVIDDIDGLGPGNNGQAGHRSKRGIGFCGAAHDIIFLNEQNRTSDCRDPAGQNDHCGR